MKKLLFVLLFLFASNLYAQDWGPLNTGYVYKFTFSERDTGKLLFNKYVRLSVYDDNSGYYLSFCDSDGNVEGKNGFDFKKSYSVSTEMGHSTWSNKDPNGIWSETQHYVIAEDQKDNDNHIRYMVIYRTVTNVDGEAFNTVHTGELIRSSAIEE